MLKNLRNTCKKYGQKAAAVGTGALVLAHQAHAALPAEVETAISDAKADGLAVAVGFLVAIIAISAIMLSRRGAKG